MYCPKCGAQNNDSNLKCPCGQLLKPVETDNALATMVPYKNVPALVAYYLGVFSAIPCIGLFLGIAAFILGFKGLKVSKERPEAKGRVHAWIGILVGGFFGLLYLAATILVVIGSVRARG